MEWEDYDKLTIEEIYEEIVPYFVKVDSLEDFFALAGDSLLFVSTSKWLYTQLYRELPLEVELNYRAGKKDGSIPSTLSLEEYEERYEDFKREYNHASIKVYEFGDKSFVEVFLSNPSREDTVDDRTAQLAQLLFEFDERLIEWKETIRVEEDAKRREKRAAEKTKRHNTPVDNIIDCPETIFKDILVSSIEELPTLKVVKLNVGKLQVVLDADSNVALIGKPRGNRLYGKKTCSLSVEEILSTVEDFKQ